MFAFIRAVLIMASCFTTINVAVEYENEKIIENAVVRYLKYLESRDVQFADVALAQTLLETNWFKSRIYRLNHNMFGMKTNSRSFDLPEGQFGHANYPHNPHPGECTITCYTPSIDDYAAWQKQMMAGRQINTREEYLYFLNHLPGGQRYAEDRQYTNKLTRILKVIDSCK